MNNLEMTKEQRKAMDRTKQDLVALITSYTKAYYEGRPLVSDREFDELQDELRSLDPTHPLLNAVGASVGINKIAHEFPMLSCAKVKTQEDLLKWVKGLEVDSAFVVEPKIDGLSATLVYVGGVLVSIATRGDGKIGQNIAHLKNAIRGICLTIPVKNRIEIRGELYLPKGTNVSGPLRNACVGLVNRKDPAEEQNLITFVGYQTIGLNNPTEAADLQEIAQWGFGVVVYEVCETPNQLGLFCDKYISSLRTEWGYETDGLVIVVNNKDLHKEIDGRKSNEHHHNYAMAIKPPAEAAEATLEGIEWNTSASGALIPVAVFSGVVLGGARITRATLNNCENVIGLGLKVGDVLTIERANDVIPFVKENRTSGETDLLPTHCSCGSGVVREGVHIKCVNTECSEVSIQMINKWIRACEIKEVGEATIRSVYAAGKIKTTADIYRLTPSDLSGLEGFGDKKATRFVAEVRAKQDMSVVEFLARLNIPLVGKKAIIKLGIRSLSDFVSFDSSESAIGSNVVEWKRNPSNMVYFEDLRSVLTLHNEAESNGLGVVVFSGSGPMTRKELIGFALEKGYTTADSISKSVDVLVCDTSKATTKTKRAADLGIVVLSYEEFLKS